MMVVTDKYEVEVCRAASLSKWALVDPNGVTIAEVPVDWEQAQIEAFLDGHQLGLKQGREQGRLALQMELGTLLGTMKTW